METPQDAEAAASVGFNAIQAYRSAAERVTALADKARRRGLLLLVSPEVLMAAGRAGGPWPGVVWYLRDEPDVGGMPPDRLAVLDRNVKAWSPGHMTAFVVGSGRAAARYAASGDAIMVDWYPVPHLPLESLGDNVRLSVEAAGAKPVWAVIQAFDWRDYPDEHPKRPHVGRFPDDSELRFMSYDAVVNGALGLWYYTYSRPNGKTLADSPELWSSVSEIAGEMAAMRPIFADGRSAPLPFQVRPGGVSARGWRYRGRDYVVILNRRRGFEPQVPKELLDRRWRPLFETRRDPRELLDKIGEAWYLPPYRVMVFESRLRPGA